MNSTLLLQIPSPGYGTTALPCHQAPRASNPFFAPYSKLIRRKNGPQILRCQLTTTEENKEKSLPNSNEELKVKRNLLDNASNLLTNILSGGKLGSMPIAEGAVTDLFGRPLFFKLYDWFLELGSVYKLAFGPKSFVVISDPIVARHILRENTFSYDKIDFAYFISRAVQEGITNCKRYCAGVVNCSEPLRAGRFIGATLATYGTWD